MTRSFLNQNAGARSKALFGAAMVALTATLLLVVCGSDDDSGGSSGTAITYTLTTDVLPAGSGTVNRVPNQTSYNAGTDVTLTAVAASGYTFSYWAQTASASATVSVKMDADKSMTAVFIPEGTDPCAGNPTDNPNCPGYNPCIASPGSPACCALQPGSQGCPTDPCNPFTAACCATPAGASHPNCQSSSDVVITVEIYPAGAGSVSPPGGTYAVGAQATFTATPASGYKFTNWAGGGATGSANPVTVTVSGNATITAVFDVVSGPTDPCATSPGSTACCNYNPNHTSCAGTGGGKFCYWAPNADNDFTEACVGIGGQWDDIETEAECTAEYGQVITDCANPPTSLYCRWDTGCYPLGDPNAPSADNPGMTNLQACTAYGFVSNSPTCSDYVEPAEKWYCYWANPTPGCFEIKNPNDLDPDNPGMTNKEVCAAYGEKLSQTSDCDGFIYTPPAVNYYCDWGTGGCWDMKAGTQPCQSDDPCTGTQLDHCKANGTRVVQCTGTDRPFDGTCCVGTTVP